MHFHILHVILVQHTIIRNSIHCESNPTKCHIIIIIKHTLFSSSDGNKVDTHTAYTHTTSLAYILLPGYYWHIGTSSYYRFEHFSHTVPGIII